MNRLVNLGALAVMSLGSAAVLAQGAPPTPEESAKAAVETRQGLFKLMGWNMGPIGGMLRNKVPFDAAVVAKNAERMEQLSLMIPDLFQADTSKFKIETEALEGIWASKADFNAKAAEMSKAAAALTAAAKTGDKAATLKAAGALGKSCGSCHDTFRLK